MEGSRMQTAIGVESCYLTTSNRKPPPFAPPGKSFPLWSGYVAILLFFFLLSPFSASATLILSVSEDDMTRHAAAIIVGHVKAIESYWDDQAGQIFTHIVVTSQEVLKGEVAEDAFTLKQLGGTVGHVRSWVDGSPEFRVGEKVLLFLDTNPDGSVCVAHLYQGKFSLFTDRDTGKEFAYRGETPEGVRLLTDARTARAQTVSISNEFYELMALKARIRNILRTASGEQRAASVPLSPRPSSSGINRDTQEEFALIGFPPIRWFEPDSGIPVSMSINPNGIFPSGEAQIDAGLQAWNAAPQSTFRFQKGVTTNSAGFRADGVNAISFNDPASQLPDPVNCTGVLAAVSYVTVSDESRTLHEQPFARILEADLVFANGWDNCTAFKSPANIAAVATHELGHVLGLDHSPNPEAIMFATARFDGRGATLHPDDESGVAFLYPDASFPPCTYKLSSSKRTLAGGATSAKISISTRNGCGWTAVSTVPWITITEGKSSSRKGQVIYTVESNGTKTARRGSIFIAGKTFNIRQKGTPGQRERRPPPFGG